MKTAFASLPQRLAMLALCASAMGQAWAQAAPSPQYNARIGWVSTERLFTESKLAKTADQRIEAEFSKRQKLLQEQAGRLKELSEKLDADAAKITEQWTATGSHRDPSDLKRDQAVLHTDNTTKFEDIIAVIDAIYAPQRTLRVGGAEEQIPAFNVTFSVN